MNKRDAEIVARFVTDMVAAALANFGNSDRNAVTQAIGEPIRAFFKAAEGTPGTGACICPQSPEQVRRMATLWHETFETVKLNILLDHRCPHHGEKAQPALWGRHKEKVLEVKAAEWLSLGVTHEVHS